MRINKKFKFQKGASSVMIIFLLIILTTLGAFTIVSSRANYKFSNEVLIWNKEFYKVDDKVEVFLFELDKVLSEAEVSALKYMEDRQFGNKNETDIPKSLQEENNNLYVASEDKNSILTNIFNKTYLYFAEENIKGLHSNYTGLSIKKDTDKIVLEKNFHDSGKINILLELEVKPIKYKFDFDDENITVIRIIKQERFSVIQRKEWQEQVEYDEEIILWDGN